jgi:hypothetical protein
MMAAAEMKKAVRKPAAAVNQGGNLPIANI